MQNEMFKILLKRKSKVLLKTEEEHNENICAAVTAMKNMEAYGYTFSYELLKAMSNLDISSIYTIYQNIESVIKDLIGAEISEAVVFYPNFPTQVMEMDEATLFMDQLVHYISGGTLVPLDEKQERLPLIGDKTLKVLDLGDVQDLYEIRNNLMQSNTSISGQDKEDLIYLYKTLDKTNLPEEIPFKENVAIISATLLEDELTTANTLRPIVKTATDLLRVVTYLSDGDVSLAELCKFKSFKRKHRRIFLDLLNSMKNIEEDMLRYKNRWIRVGERLHPSEYPQYQKVCEAFDKLRNNKHISTFAGEVQSKFDTKQYLEATKLLAKRPAELARRLDELLRKVDSSEQLAIIEEFETVASQVSSRVLLQVLEHFYNRSEKQAVRVVFPKGSVAQATILPELPPLDEVLCDKVTEICQKALISIYSSRESLGKVYIDPELSSYIIPYSQRSASKAMKAVTRGSHIKLSDNINVLRGFIHWTNTEGSGYNNRVDIDLSACVLDENWEYKSHVSYTRLRDGKMKIYHSGDITDGGPADGKGVAEFLDCDIDSIVRAGGRYIVYQVYSFTEQSFNEIPHVSFGWMEREECASGEIFEPSTVEQKMDLACESTVSIPVIFDCVEREIIWCDMNLSINQMSERSGGNNLESNFNKATATCYAMANMNKVDMYYLAYLHTMARGELVSTREEADIIFSNDTTKPLIEVEIEIKDEDGEVIETKIEQREKDVKFVTAFDVDEFYALI